MKYVGIDASVDRCSGKSLRSLPITSTFSVTVTESPLLELLSVWVVEVQ